MTESITPRSDQINSEDLLTGARTVTVTGVTRGSVEQPVDIVTAEFGPGRPYKPSKTMRRILVAAWGKDASAYTGRRITIYRDPEIKFGAEKVGGIRISHLSHIDKPLTISLTETRGKRKPHRIEPLPDAPAGTAPAPLPERVTKVLTAFKAIDITEAQIVAKLGKPRDQWDADDVAQVGVIYISITKGGADKGELFPGSTPITAGPPTEVEAVTDEQIQDLAMAREQVYGKTISADGDWAAWVAETLGHEFSGNDKDLTCEEADDLLALLAAKDAK